MLIVLHWTTPEAKQRGIVAMDSCFAISIAVFCLQELIFLAHLLKTNLTKFTAIWLKKGQRVGFLRLISSIIPAPAKEKEKKRRKSEEKRTGGEDKKAMAALLVFIMAIHGYSGPDPNLEIRGGQSSRPFEKSGGGGGCVGGLQKTFRPFGPQFGLKIGPPPPLDPPLLFWRWFWSKKKTVWKKLIFGS